jgi:hypothetical protein
MEKLLALKGIKSVSYTDKMGIAHKYFYTDKLQASNIIIEFFEMVREEEEEELVEEEGYSKYETSLIAYTTQEKICYKFTMLFDTRSYVPALYIYRILLDLVEIIENSNDNRIIENLEDAANASMNSHTCQDDDKRLKKFNEHVNSKLKLVSKLIGETKIQGN